MKTTSLVILIFLTAFVLGDASSALLAQHIGLGIPEMVNFSKDEYEGGTQNWSIVQDSTGLLYFGNNKGVLIFDGTYWQRLTLPNHTIVRSLWRGTNDRIWVGGQDELGFLFHDDLGGTHYQSLIHLLPETERSFEDVWTVQELAGKTYFCTRSGIFIFDGETFEVVHPAESFGNVFLVNDRLFAQENSLGLLEWKIDKFELVTGGEQFTDNRIACMMPHANDKLLIVSDYAGLFQLGADGVQLWNTGSSSFLIKNQAYCGLQLQDGRYAIGTVQDGMLLMDASGEPLAHYNKASGLQNNSILSMALDSYGNFWLGLDNGLDYIKQGTPFGLVEEDSGIAGTGYCVAMHENQLLLGTNQGLYQVEWPIRSEPFRPKALATHTELKTQIWNFSSVGEELVVNTHEGAYRKTENGFELLSPRHGSWGFMKLANGPSYWIEGAYNGLFLYEMKAGRLTFIRHLDGFEESARVFEQDESGNIWVSHAYKGLFRISLNDQQAIEEVRYYGAENGLPTNININVVKINEELLFTTPQGVYQYLAADDRFVPAKRMEELLGEQANIRRLVAENKERLWFVLQDELGFLQISPEGLLTDQLVEKHYRNTLQGKLVEGFEEVFSLDDANTLIATEDGFINYCHSCFDERPLPFQVLIRKIEAYQLSESNALEEEIEITTDGDEVRLPTATENIRFSYAAPFFEDLDGLVYRYRLKGFQEQWSDWSKRTEKEYSHLPHGAYLFEVEAKNAYGQTSNTIAQSFEIAAPWYLTASAKTLYLLLGLGGLFLLYRWATYKAVKDREQVIEAQAAQLAQTEADFQQQKAQSAEEIMRLRNENLHADIQHRNSQLAAATMHLVQKGEVLQKIKKDLEKLKPKIPSENRRPIQQLINTIDANTRLDDNWQQFEAYFDQVHENFLKNLREAYPQLTPKDQRLCAYLRMNLSTKEIAPLMNISVRGVEISRYRLRKKLALDTDVNLTDFIMRF